MNSNRRFFRVLCFGLALLLSDLPLLAQQSAATTPPPQPVQTASLPDSPSASLPPQQTSQQPAQQTPPAAQRPAARPSGTAASEMTNVGGITASEPAGVAIAPAKQRRTRSILIKMGAILGAGAAVGTVAALSMSGGSKPPGAR